MTYQKTAGYNMKQVRVFLNFERFMILIWLRGLQAIGMARNITKESSTNWAMILGDVTPQSV